MKFCLVLLLFYGFPAYALELSWDFSDRSNLESSTLVYNQALQALHPSLRVMNFKAGFTPLDFEVGDGRHGAFNSSTYANFSKDADLSGQIIRIDVSQFPSLQVTEFSLDSGWTIEVIGDAPLVIYSLTDVTIIGRINCNGEDGGNAVGAIPGTGGQGRCGGGDGGNGGAPGNDGNSGGDVDTTITGGQFGNFTGGAAVGGGGGGSSNITASAGTGTNSSGAGGQAGLMVNDPEFTQTFGGAGGGGGSGTATEGGAGGGGGGGTVIIHAVRNFHLGRSPASIIGFIDVSGGKGGDSNVAGGAGGGGGGGSVQVFAGRDIEIFNIDGGGASIANAGAVGNNTAAGNGGVGGLGRSWLSSVSYNPTGVGFYNPPEHISITAGNVEFNSATQTAVSRTFDLQSTKATIDAITVQPVSSDFLVELRGSEDNFESDDTGWTTNLNLIENKRYVKIRASITTTNVNSPTMLSDLKITYQLGQAEVFDFEAAGCGALKTPPKPPFYLLLLLPIILLIYLRISALEFKS